MGLQTHSYKASGSEGIPAELLKTPKDESVKVLHSCQQIWKSKKWPQDWKRSIFHSNPKDRAVPKNVQATMTALTSHASRVMLKMLQARVQQYMNRELPYA